MNLGVEALGRAVCWGRIARKSIYICAENPSSLQNCFKHQLNIRSSLRCIRFWKFFFFQFFNGIFCGDTTKISFVDRQFFKASASFPPVDWGNWLVLIYFYCLLTNHSFLFSEKFSFCFLLFASCFLVFALYLALLSANQTQHNFWDVYYKRKIKSCRIFAPTSFKDAEFLHF